MGEGRTEVLLGRVGTPGRLQHGQCEQTLVGVALTLTCAQDTAELSDGRADTPVLPGEQLQEADTSLGKPVKNPLCVEQKVESFVMRRRCPLISLMN